MSARTLVVGISGASGIPYAVRFVEMALRLGHRVHLVVSSGAWRVMQEECAFPNAGPAAPLASWLVNTTEEERARIVYHQVRDIAAAPASGTFRADAMVVIPASMKTLAGLASGYSDNLLLRAGDVFLKERRPLVLVPRETPLSLIHLRNMVTLAEAGAHILPAMPGFYSRPRTIDDMVDFICMKVFDVLGIAHDIPGAWTGPRRQPSGEPDARSTVAT